MEVHLEIVTEYPLKHMWDVFSQVFGDGESEFEAISKIRGP